MVENPIDKDLIDHCNQDIREHVVFKTVINGVLTEVWQKREAHRLGLDNSRPENWWAKVVYKEVGEHGGDMAEWVPFIDIGSNRMCWGVTFEQGNRTKCKWNRTQINRTGHVNIQCNLRTVYSFGVGDLNFGLTKAQHLIHIMQEHAFSFADPDSEIGRKIWYMRQPGVVERLLLDQGSIMIKYVGKAKGFNMKQPWDEDEFDVSEWDGQEEVKDDVLSENIWWFR